MNFWHHLLPTYGKYGGPGWSGGVRVESYEGVNWAVVPEDSLDELFQIHDQDYELAIKKKNCDIVTPEEMFQLWINADLILIKSMNDLSKNPIDWKRTPTKIWYAKFYRKIAIYAFRVKVFLMKILHPSI